MSDSPFVHLVDQLAGIRFQIWGLVKIAVLISIFLYIGFSVMIVRQVDLMGRSLSGSFRTPLKTLAWLYLLATIVVFVLAAILL